jgi:hypothetical protein
MDIIFRQKNTKKQLIELNPVRPTFKAQISLRRLWVLNIGNMQAIQKGFYLSHDKFFEINSNIFGQPTLYGLIEHKTVL